MHDGLGLGLRVKGLPWSLLGRPGGFSSSENWFTPLSYVLYSRSPKLQSVERAMAVLELANCLTSLCKGSARIL